MHLHLSPAVNNFRPFTLSCARACVRKRHGEIVMPVSISAAFAAVTDVIKTEIKTGAPRIPRSVCCLHGAFSSLAPYRQKLFHCRPLFSLTGWSPGPGANKRDMNSVYVPTWMPSKKR